jgi:hypothetical protein
MELMSTKVRHLPVLENEIVIGIISMRCGKSNYRNAKDTIQHLNSYITQVQLD